MQRNRKTYEENNQLIETDSEVTQITELVDKGYKTTIINIFQMFKNKNKAWANKERWKIRQMNRQVDIQIIEIDGYR